MSKFRSNSSNTSVIRTLWPSLVSHQKKPIWLLILEVARVTKNTTNQSRAHPSNLSLLFVFDSECIAFAQEKISLTLLFVLRGMSISTKLTDKLEESAGQQLPPSIRFNPSPPTMWDDCHAGLPESFPPQYDQESFTNFDLFTAATKFKVMLLQRVSRASSSMCISCLCETQLGF